MVHVGSRAGAESIDSILCERLATRAAVGDKNAFQELVEVLWPFWAATVRRSRSMGALRSNEDAVREVQTRLIEKLSREDFRALRQYGEWARLNPSKSFADWMRIVSANVVRSYLREELSLGRAPSLDPSRRAVFRDFFVHCFESSDEVAIRPPVTPVQTARELVEFARHHLTKQQWSALADWLEGFEFDEIGSRAGGLDAAEGRKLVRSACAVLRRRFTDSAA